MHTVHQGEKLCSAFATSLSLLNTTLKEIMKKNGLFFFVLMVELKLPLKVFHFLGLY